MIVIFSGYHFVRGDEFSLPRTLIASLVYLLFVPWNKISRQWIYYIVALASVICGLNALYEHFVMNIARVGIATNPIPYALYVSFLLLCCVYFVLNQSDKVLKTLAGIGGLLSLAAIIMTDVRGVILFLPVAILYLMIVAVKPTVKHYIFLCFSICVISVLFYAFFEKEIDTRIKQTQYEISMIEKGNHNTS
ncbi:ligase, partial [Vibrio anguillarum]|nr:ligase [Vibrio anguillarum]